MSGDVCALGSEKQVHCKQYEVSSKQNVVYGDDDAASDVAETEDGGSNIEYCSRCEADANDNKRRQSEAR